MAVTHAFPYLRLTWTFGIATTKEIAQCHVAIGDTTMGEGVASLFPQVTPELLQTWMGYLTDLLTAEPSKWGWADYSYSKQMKIAYIGTNGKYVGQPTVLDITQENLVSGQTHNILPQSTICASLRTELSQGKMRKGKMYLPHSQFVLPYGAPQASGASTTTLAADVAGLIHDVDTDLLALVNTTRVVVVSSHDVGPNMNPAGVTTVECDGLTDTQQRRRHQLASTYSTATV